MTWVYIIAAGERDEGHSPLVVHPNLDAAKAHIAALAPNAGPLEKVAHHRWCAVMPGGVDELWIYSMPVRGTR